MKYLQFFATADITMITMCFIWAYKALMRRKIVGFVSAFAAAAMVALFARWALNRPVVELSHSIEFGATFMFWPLFFFYAVPLINLQSKRM